MRYSLALSGLTLACSVLSVQSQVVTPLNSLYGDEEKQGFVKLFDGTRADFANHWVDYQQNNPNTATLNAVWVYNDSNKSMNCNLCKIDLRSKTMYKDFDMRFQYKCSGNQGFFYRFTLDYPKAYQSGVEYAIDENTTQADKKVIAGAAYALYEPIPEPYHHYSEANPWNECRVIVIGDSVEHWMNGQLIVKYRYFSADYMARYKISKWYPSNTMSFAKANDQSAGPILNGYIGWQADHPGNMDIRNLRINTNPSWSTPYQWPPAATSIASAKPEIKANARVTFQGSRFDVEVPGEILKSATLVDYSGRVRGEAAISSRGTASFASQVQNGLYFMKYKNTSGASHSLVVSLLSPR